MTSNLQPQSVAKTINFEYIQQIQQPTHARCAVQVRWLQSTTAGTLYVGMLRLIFATHGEKRFGQQIYVILGQSNLSLLCTMLLTSKIILVESFEFIFCKITDIFQSETIWNSEVRLAGPRRYAMPCRVMLCFAAPCHAIAMPSHDVSLHGIYKF